VTHLKPVIDAIGWILPDLSRLDWRPWPMYGLAPDGAAVLAALLMAGAYCGLLLALAVLTFNRREFE
jgi:hypothetical protein